jgi:Tol biopolymer transport system component
MAQSRTGGLSRRRLFSLGGALVAAGAAAGQAAVAEAAPGPDETRYVTAVQGVNIAPAVSPDGAQVAFDLYGILWLVPVGGGPARRLTEDLLEIAQPDWFPDGHSLVFQSYRDGGFHLWTVGVDGGAPRQLTSGPFDDREPRVSPDGERIAFSSDRGGRYGVYILDLASGDIAPVEAGPGEVCEPAWSPDGRTLAVAVDKARILAVPLGGGAPRIVAQASPATERLAAGQFYSPAFTPDGKDVIFTAIENGRAELRTGAGVVVVAGEDVFPFRASWLPSGEFLYAADGHIRRRALAGGDAREVGFSVVAPVTRPSYTRKVRDFTSAGPRPVVGIGAPALSPDGTSVAFRALNDIYLMKLGERARPLITGAAHKLDPAWSPDGRALAYASDRGGKLDLWIHDFASGEDRKLTHFDAAAVSPAWSRDGREIAFLSQNGALHVADAASGETRRLYDDLWEPGKPSWSPDGKTIVMAAFKPYSARFREGLSEILAVDVATGVGRYQPVRPHRSLGTRGDDGPVWSPDGKRLAFVFASRLHLAGVDAAGQLTSDPTPINDEVTDAPTWSGDGTQILYLSAGKLRLIASGGGAPRTIEHGLTWAQVRAGGRLVVAAGRLWDGMGPELRRDVEIVVEQDRIAAVVPRGAGPTGANTRRVDATARTVMPGLVDMHTHRQMQGYGYGGRDGRLWLSLGVTTTRSPGGPAYHTVEDQEAIESGARLGPRYFATGEAIDGSRIYYNFMRPVTEPGQMALELRRAEALNYDLIKTYVRLSAERQGEVIAWAHAYGLPVTSHYHYPALALAADGMEHMGATARTGYSRTVSLLGGVYQDVTAAFLASHAPRTPTLFLAQAMFPDDRSLIDDRRTRTLYPPWEYARLTARLAQLQAQDRTAQLEALARQVAGARDVLRAGGRIVSGTDSPIDFNAISLHMNLRAMVRYGLTPYEALVTATRASGEFLGQPLGVVRGGHFADLAIVDGDPLTRIEDAAAVTTVVRAGVPHTVEELLGAYPTQPLASAAVPRRFVCETPPQFWWHDPAWLEAARATCCDGGCGL